MLEPLKVFSSHSDLHLVESFSKLGLSLFPEKKVAKAMHIFTVVDMLIQRAQVASRSNHDKKLRHVS